jgi:cytochrome c553
MRCLLTLMTALLTVFATATLADTHNIALLAASCAACHGTEGHSQGGTPSLAGLDETYFIKQMQQFKSGERSSTVMMQQASGLTDDEINALAEYFAAPK